MKIVGAVIDSDQLIVVETKPDIDFVSPPGDELVFGKVSEAEDGLLLS